MIILINVLIFIPIIAGIVLGSIFSEKRKLLELFSIITAIASFLISIIIFYQFVHAENALLFVSQKSWISRMGIEFKIGVDGISACFISLTHLVILFVLLLNKKLDGFTRQEIFPLLLVVSGILTGFFAALDLFLLLFLYALSFIPIYLMMNFEGDHQRKLANKYFIFQIASFLFVMAGVLLIYVGQIKTNGFATLDISYLSQYLLPEQLQKFVMVSLLIGFGIRMPLFPVHGWLADIIADQSAPIRILIVTLGMKTGLYGIFRVVLNLCPDAIIELQYVLIYTGLITFIYGAIIALTQMDIHKIFAYGCMSQAGLIVLGIFSMDLNGMTGAMFHIINHSIFMLILLLLGATLKINLRSSLLADIQGTGQKCRFIGAMIVFVSFAYIGFPPFSGYTGIFLLLGGISFQQIAWMIITIFGLLITASYMMRFAQSIALGSQSEIVETISISTPLTNKICISTLLFLILCLGLFPQLMISPIQTSLQDIHQNIEIHKRLKQRKSETHRKQKFSFDKFTPSE